MSLYEKSYKIAQSRSRSWKAPFGFAPSTVAKFEKGENVSMDVLDKICNHFGVPLSKVIEHIKEE